MGRSDGGWGVRAGWNGPLAASVSREPHLGFQSRGRELWRLGT